MMRTRYLVLTGVIAYLAFLIASVPAAAVIGLLQDRLPFTVNNVSGTLWNGSAGTVDTRQKIVLKDVAWSFLPSRLLLARATIDVAARLNGKPLTTRVAAGVTGTVTLQDLNVQLDATDVEPFIKLPIGKLSGEFEARIDRARLLQGTVPRVDGTILWNRATVTVAETADLGNVSVQLSETDTSPLSASISNKGGHLSLNGSFAARDKGDYTLQLTLKPNNTASNNLVSSLAMFARKQPNGEFLLNNQGNLAQLGLM